MRGNRTAEGRQAVLLGTALPATLEGTGQPEPLSQQKPPPPQCALEKPHRATPSPGPADQCPTSNSGFSLSEHFTKGPQSISQPKWTLTLLLWEFRNKPILQVLEIKRNFMAFPRPLPSASEDLLQNHQPSSTALSTSIVNPRVFKSWVKLEGHNFSEP